MRLTLMELNPSMQHSLAEILCARYASGLNFAMEEQRITIGNRIPRYMEFFPCEVAVVSNESCRLSPT